MLSFSARDSVIRRSMWRPMEIFLYEWWPLARERRLLRRLAAARIEVVAQRAAG